MIEVKRSIAACVKETLSLRSCAESEESKLDCAARERMVEGCFAYTLTRRSEAPTRSEASGTAGAHAARSKPEVARDVASASASALARMISIAWSIGKTISEAAAELVLELVAINRFMDHELYVNLTCTRVRYVVEIKVLAASYENARDFHLHEAAPLVHLHGSV